MSMHILAWLLVSWTSEGIDQNEEKTPVTDVLNITAVPQNTSQLLPEFHYDKIFIKFDPECLEHAEVDIVTHFKQAISESQRAKSGQQDTKNGSGFTSLNRLNATTGVNDFLPTGDQAFNLQDQASPELPDPDIFERILKTHLTDAKAVVGSSFMNPTIHDTVLEMAAPPRQLGSMPRSSREDEILSAFHLLAATSLVGHDHVAELLNLEKRGKYDEVVELVKKHKKLSIADKQFQKALQKLAARKKSRDEKSLQYIRSLAKAKNVTEKQLMNEETWMGTQALSVVIDTERLNTLDISIIDNPFMEHHLLRIAALLPCISLHPEPDRTKDTVEVRPLSELRVKPRRFLESKIETAKTLPIQLAERLSASTDFNGSNETGFFGLFKRRTSPTIDPNTEYYLIVPNDVSFDAQWYLRGEAQEEKFGAQVVDGWSAMLWDLHLNRTTSSGSSSRIDLDFADLDKVSYGMTVAVLDSGCSRNPDLINQFWRNPNDETCKEGVYVSSSAGTSASKISGDCVGYDFGNDDADPTQEIPDKIHGSSTSGLIAAEANNALGVTGICPHCRIMCIKIYDTEKQKITMSSVVRALEYIAEKKVKLSNHSYGGFGESAIELAAHKTLQGKGHLTVCSAGNNGCNIDKDSADPNACVDDSGGYPGPFTPASYKLDSILSVGGSDRDGSRAWFSNYGKDSVHVYAPGKEIVTLYGESKLATVQGTSFSAPIVTGLAAVLWSYKPELTASEVKRLLVTTGNPNTQLEGTAQEARIVSLSRALGTSQTARLAGGVSRVGETLSYMTILLWASLVNMLL